ncbi:lecithin retinol acyltransferase family protein [Prochlorococcus sp. MIT 1307]|uniref:lecithin retinol acyltransferase family protein n=1 Tax=Prochlorococcus sp. MIT 1307 TaxID=3096219 RepID=UPI002A755538|nr:lecithin retinol acyltransferase family protein [Prochlorococcus sp. MIT 1307]
MSVADHLEVPRHHGLFKHHGIDLGDGTVAHYQEGHEILRSSIQDFSAGQNIKVIIHDNASSNDLTLRRAISRIGEQRYNLLFNNCEHFANWCKTGKHHSNQTEDFLKKSSLGAMAIGTIIPAAFWTTLNLLLKQDLTDKSTQQKAQKITKILKRLRLILINKLESTLQELEGLINTNQQSNTSPYQNQKTQALIVQGQNLGDQLNTIESVEVEITRLLKKAKSKK